MEPELQVILQECRDELVFLHRSHMIKNPDSEGIPRVMRLIQKIERKLGIEAVSPYPVETTYIERLQAACEAANAEVSTWPDWCKYRDLH